MVCFLENPETRALTVFSEQAPAFVRSASFTNKPKKSADLTVSIEKDESGFYVQSEKYGIVGFGANVSEAYKDYQVSLKDAWDGLKGESDGNLTADAIKLRNILAQHFASSDAQGA